MISLGLRDLGFQTICFIQRLLADEDLGGSNNILSGSGRSDLKCTLFLGRDMAGKKVEPEVVESTEEGVGGAHGICNPSCGILSRTRCLPGGMAQELSEKELLRMQVEQLKKEVKNPRAPISKTGKEIKEYVEAEAGNDPLLKGVPEDKNPFKEKGSCVIS
ncbi:hypothetical protein HPG69_003011 [Diceros bicornis minor]|uniref:Guanine nucleotide-binding protein subunit gamma n=2 Tax=Rhinocerotidae TaxID=9803 RepID=A0A7J7EJN1_DICBM|nr:hypothetical protein HPG69_003011 [Diceros bicornis minor]